MSQEQVLCFRRSFFDALGRFQGVSVEVERYLPSLLNASIFLPREGIEENTDYKQIIPYVIVVCDNQIFRYRRGSEQEARLHALHSIGIGGHIKKEDGIDNTKIPMVAAMCSMTVGMEREIREEFGSDVGQPSHAVALVNDDETKVGQVHLGVVHILRVKDTKIHPSCSQQGPEFVPINQLYTNFDTYEQWSKLCLQELPLLLCQYYTFGPEGNSKKVPVKLIRQGDVPGTFLVRLPDGKTRLAFRSNLS